MVAATLPEVTAAPARTGFAGALAQFLSHAGGGATRVWERPCGATSSVPERAGVHQAEVRLGRDDVEVLLAQRGDAKHRQLRREAVRHLEGEGGLEVARRGGHELDGERHARGDLPGARRDRARHRREGEDLTLLSDSKAETIDIIAEEMI